jgi:hypothetical protein
LSQGNFDDLVGYEEECGPQTVLEAIAAEPLFTEPAA